MIESLRVSHGCEATAEAHDAEAQVEATGNWLAIDLPDQRVDLIRHLVTLPLGRSMVLSALPDADAPGRVLALIAGVREIDLPRD